MQERARRANTWENIPGSGTSLLFESCGNAGRAVVWGGMGEWGEGFSGHVALSTTAALSQGVAVRTDGHQGGSAPFSTLAPPARCLLVAFRRPRRVDLPSLKHSPGESTRCRNFAPGVHGVCGLLVPLTVNPEDKSWGHSW